MKTFVIPGIGNYTPMINDFFKELDLNLMQTPEITPDVIKLGIKHSPNMICYPFKITLGIFIEALQNGATDLIMYNTCGQCRFRQYYKIQELIMKDLGYKFNMHQIRTRTIIFDLKKLNKKNSYFKIIKMIFKYHRRLKELENS